MKFKSESIQSIYDFLEQDADVSEFKRDLIAVAEYKKIPLQDLEADCLQYADLIKEDLTDKITFVFREEGYLGMFSPYNPNTYKVVNDYNELKTGDNVSVVIEKNYLEQFVKGIIYISHDGKVYIIQNTVSGGNRIAGDWEKYGKYNWCLSYADNGRVGGHKNLKKAIPVIDNMKENEYDIKDLINRMHFALVL